MNFAVHFYLIKGAMIGFELVEDVDGSNWLVIDLFCCRFMVEFNGEENV